jgi:hydrogenase nickel incorporation protein HypB
MASRTNELKRDIRAEHLAAANSFRRRMTSAGTFVVRLLSSPGAGKTALLESTAGRLSSHRIGILVGDVETQRDAERLAPFAPTMQITTGGACHLEIPLVETGYAKLDESQLDFLFIEDVGNLVCPASHDLGEHLRVVLLSTPEGDDKPGKYPKAFRTSQVLVISKRDLLPYVPFSIERAAQDARCIQPDIGVLSLSALTGEGMEAWGELLIEKRHSLLAGAGLCTRCATEEIL